MKTTKTFVARASLALVVALLIAVSLASPNAGASAPLPQAGDGALERGYRTGYSDGYQAGWSDVASRAAYDFRVKTDYQNADRAYLPAHGPREDYRDGYRQGFELGYEAGYNRRGFDSTLPSGLARRGVVDDFGDRPVNRPAVSGAADTQTDDAGTSVSGNVSTTTSRSTSSGAVVPADTILLVELLNRLSTDVTQRGDRFEARVVEPSEFEGAIVSGRVSYVERPGKTRGRAQMQLDFDQIRTEDGQVADFRGQVVEVVNTDGTTAATVDPEGGVRGRDSTKDDLAKVGAGAGIGAIIGAIAGGGKGAAIGAVIGGAAGTARVVTERGKELRFERGQQLRVRAAGR